MDAFGSSIGSDLRLASQGRSNTSHQRMEPVEGESSRTWEQSAPVAQRAYNLRQRTNVPIWSQLKPKLRQTKNKPEKSRKSVEPKALPQTKQTPEESRKSIEDEALRQTELTEYLQRARKGILKMVDKIQIPKESHVHSENRTEITNAGSAVVEMENWRPYFLPHDIGLFKTTLKGASWATEKLALQAAPSVAGLKSLTAGDKYLFSCSGTIVKSSEKIQQIVTVANLVKKSQDTDELADSLKINVYLQNHVTCSGDLLYYDFHYNICVIQIESSVSLPEKVFTSHIEAINFDNSCPRDVVALGRDNESHHLSVSRGKVIPKSSTFNCEELLISTCRISKAAVGGPLMNMDGNFIGMNFYHNKETPFIPSFIVLKCLQQFKFFGKVVKPWHGLQVRTLYAEGCHAFEKMQSNILRGSTGVIIEKVGKLSSSKVDLNEGDIINRVNGVYFSNAAELGGILLDLATSHLLDPSSSLIRCIKFGVMGCERERTVLVDKPVPNGLNRWPFPEPIIVRRYVDGELDDEEWYAMES